MLHKQKLLDEKIWLAFNRLEKHRKGHNKRLPKKRVISVAAIVKLHTKTGICVHRVADVFCRVGFQFPDDTQDD